MNISLKTARKTLELNEAALAKNPHSSELKEVVFKIKKLIVKLDDEQDARAKMLWSIAEQRADRIGRQSAVAAVLSSAAGLGLSISLSPDAGWGEIGAAQSAVIVAETLARFKNLFSLSTENFPAPGGTFKKLVSDWRVTYEQETEKGGSAGSDDAGLSIKRPKLGLRPLP